MYKARYYKADGQNDGAQDLPDAVFDGVVNEGVLHLAVKVHLANQRQGTHSAKTRSEVAGGGRKPWKQKGTGRARQGTIRAPQWEGGGVAFPPIPHGWRQKLPRKVRGLARRSALNARAAADRVIVIDALAFDKPSTRQLVTYLGSIGAAGKVLVLTDGVRDNVHLSCRNVKGLRVLPFGAESAYDILYATTVVIERNALASIPSGGASDQGEDTDA